MPRNFDTNRRPVAADDERQFTICGQTFTIRKRVKPEVLGRLEEVGSDKSVDQNIDLIDGIVEGVLAKRDIPRWRELRASDDDDDVVELADMQEIITWAVEKLTNRPLDSASSSIAGTAAIEPPSPLASSLPEGFPSTV